ncbi:hypothetical protein EJ08DRAFT_652571 [Tothia fuscella]|uniref:DUF1993 domain-containing protein n=1 Tax=Tothia fuscella TaxID=1048955 RepID=A0A9P4TVG2_9PEZI|nr:hypothetical protein EJ08DRAFT_652571 [Tothia fuscella]
MPSLYEISVPAFIRGLNQLTHCLKKAETYASENNKDISSILKASLHPDMKALPFQIQTVSNTAKNACVRVAGIEAVPMEDNETTLPQFYERIEKTIKLLEGVDAKAFEGKEEQSLEAVGMKFTGQSYLLTFEIPNFYFHLTAAYAILRKEGVPLGKMDFLGAR